MTVADVKKASEHLKELGRDPNSGVINLSDLPDNVILAVHPDGHVEVVIPWW